MLTVVSVTNPKYTNEENTTIDCMVKFAEIEDALPYHATPTDTAAHGQIIYNNLIDGVYGPIAPYEP